MKRLLTAVAVIGLAFGFTSMSAMAQSGTGGSGSGAGVTVGCGSASNTTSANISACGTVTGSSTPTPSGTQYSLSGPLTLQVTGSNPAVESLVGDDLTPGSETLDFTISNVFVSSGGTVSGTFSLTDIFNGGDADFEVDGTITGLVPLGTAIGSWVLTLDPTSVDAGGSCECTGTGPVSVSGVTGTMTIDFDPGSVTGVSAGLSGGPFGSGGTGSTTPEPGTLLLLGSGLVALGFMARKFGCA